MVRRVSQYAYCLVVVEYEEAASMIVVHIIVIVVMSNVFKYIV